MQAINTFVPTLALVFFMPLLLGCGESRLDTT
jgi:hypothetical protein